MTTQEKETLYAWIQDVMHVLRQHVGQTPAVEDAEKTAAEFRRVADVQVPNHPEDE